MLIELDIELVVGRDPTPERVGDLDRFADVDVGNRSELPSAALLHRREEARKVLLQPEDVDAFDRRLRGGKPVLVEGYDAQVGRGRIALGKGEDLASGGSAAAAR